METEQKPFSGQILESAKILGYSLPESATQTEQPSFYLEQQCVPQGFEAVYERIAFRIPEQQKEKLEELYGWFREYFCEQKNLKFHPEDLDIFFADWVLHCRKMGFRIQDYFDYELYNKSYQSRKTFISYRYRNKIIAVCINKEDRETYLDDKAVFNETFREFLERDWLDLCGCTWKDMKRFCRKNPTFFAKQRLGQGGEGALYYRNVKHPPEELYAQLKENQMILEEYVYQHPSIAAFHPDSLNTIRVLTLTDAHGEIHVMSAAGRFGRAGKAVDNFHGGGIVVEVDPHTGTVISKGIDRQHNRYAVHPDSGKAFRGFVYPCWDKVIALVRKAAQKLPSLRHVGWDVAVTEQGNAVLIEGNGRPDMNMMQMAGQRGKKRVYQDLIGEIEEQDKGGQHD